MNRIDFRDVKTPLRTFSMLAAGAMLMACHNNEQASSPNDEMENYSYAVGLELAGQLEPIKSDVDLATVEQAMTDALARQSPRLTEGQAHQVRDEFRRMHLAQLQEKSKALAEKNRAAGAAFFDANSHKPGVVTTTTGLQYQVLVAGTGPRPGPTDEVLVRYKASLLDGSIFENSLEQTSPTALKVETTCPGMREALQLMPIGSRYRLFIPGVLAYGNEGLGLKVGPQAAVIYEVDLAGIVR